MSFAFHWYSEVVPTTIAVFDAVTLCAVHDSCPTRPYFSLAVVLERSVAKFTVANVWTTSVK